MNCYEEIKNKIIDEEIYSKIKDYSKESHKLITYYEIGKLLAEAGGKYGAGVIEQYSKKLMIEVGKKYTRSTLFKMRQLNWSQCLIIIPLKDINKIYYYAKQVIKRNLSKRQLQDIIKNKEYERLPGDAKEKLLSKEEITKKDEIPNPILIKQIKK